MIAISDLQGHWRRDWIRAAGFEDCTAHVHWLQAGVLFADLRVPDTLPDIGGKTCLADLDGATLAALLDCEGFAGEISLTGDHCTWHRHINWHGMPDRPDVGAMSFAANDTLIEDGVHADYREAWSAVQTGPLRGHKIGWGDMTGVLIENDAEFLFAIGSAPTRIQKPVVLASGDIDRDSLQKVFSSFYALGRWDGATGTALLSTNPFARDQVVIERTTSGLVWHALLFAGGSAARRLDTIN